ncbi:beta-amylase 7-like [Macadamia integrifolia]|uniref:beta-amylase 7-like n=1 Tax=Macadamia integrifolia TaxID=60698 RepID=UPI001C52E5FD|nr:beta-amylase 7-like [Macadamia integrifolia]
MNEEMMMRSASDKERTKMRERQRRSITTKIFHGLRKHGGYNLPPRSDINDVLRELAREAGWVVEPDGTTYRAPSWLNHHHHNNKSSSSTTTTTTTTSAHNVAVEHVPHYHSYCLAGKNSKTPTPTSSFGGGGECSTTASPRKVAVFDTMPQTVGSVRSAGPNSLYLGAGACASSYHRFTAADPDLPVSLYCGIGFPSNGILNGSAQLSAATGDAAAFSTGMATMLARQQLHFTESRASSENSPVASPHRGPH